MPIFDRLKRTLAPLAEKDLGELKSVQWANKQMDRVTSPWVHKGLMYAGLPIAAYAMASSLNPVSNEETEGPVHRWDRLSTAHMAAGGVLGGLLGAVGSKYLPKGESRIWAPFLGAGLGALAGHEVSAPFHYTQKWKNHQARRAPYVTAAGQQTGLPWAVGQGDIGMDPDEMRRRQILGF